jgi:hypothetical protein
MKDLIETMRRVRRLRMSKAIQLRVRIRTRLLRNARQLTLGSVPEATNPGRSFESKSPIS